MTTKLQLDEFKASTFEEWKAAAEESLKGAPFEKKLLTRTHEGITLKPIYNASDIAALAEQWPGLPDFTRSSGPLPRRPLVSQEIPVGLPADFNQAALHDLMRGQDALAIQLDPASRRNLDPSEATTGEVAACGLSLACLEDARAAFAGIEPGAIHLLLWAGASALPMLGLFEAHSPSWRGGILGDPLGEYARDGSLPIALDDAFTEMAAAVKWSLANGSRLRTVGIQGNLWSDSGASSIEEMAFSLSSAVACLRELDARGLPPSQTAGQFVFSLGVGSDVLLQIAKFRAFRKLWAGVLEACGAPPAPAFIHARGTLFNKTWLDPYTNMLRSAAEALAAFLGGADSLHVAAFDEAARLPGEFSRRIARNVHSILAEECEFEAAADPAGGSWAIESLTCELAAKAWELFQKLESQGGFVSALTSGFAQETAAATAAKRLEAAATRRDGYIGVNLFPNPAETPLDGGPPDFRALHSTRAAAIESLRLHAQPKIERSVEAAAAAFAAGATLGQIREALPRSAPTEPQVAKVRPARAAEGYETLRLAALRHAKAHGSPPRAWLACFGPPKQHKARADFSSGFLAAGGFAIEQSKGAASIEEAVEAAAASGAPLVVICSTDETYPELVGPFIAGLRAKCPKALIALAGYPPDHIEAFQKAGVDIFIHLRANCLETLSQIHKSLGL
ncbi:MAG: methylmalonyl-CoA mutase family protein [Terrimicrobiaceae bacterium]|nr:methylmalonyl-CoA mutase family protein [Terrimicrobiaceae bacterium]